MEKNGNLIKQIPFKFDSRYVFSDAQTRIFRIVSNQKSFEKLVKKTQFPFIFTTDQIPLLYDYSLNEAMMKEAYSKISWIIYSEKSYSPILLSFNLTENTIEKTVLVIFEIKIIKRELIPKQYINKINISFPKICVEMINNLIKELKEDNKDIYHYESKILKYSREKVWEIMSNFHIFLAENGIIQNCNMNTPIKEKGCEITFNMNYKNKTIFCKLKVNEFIKDEENNKWKLGYFPLQGPFLHKEQFWTLVKLSENETFVSNINKYAGYIDLDIINEITYEKIETFKVIENILKDVYRNNYVNKNIK